jgi:ribonuclease J
VEIGPDDLVIISASPIPGNEKTVSKVINELSKRGATVITSKQEEVHVSGHASQEEHKMMLALTKPRFFIPMHGEFAHLKAHADTARAMGVTSDRIIISDIGKVIELTATSCRLDGTVPSGKVLIDGLGVGDVGNVVLRDRRHLAADGLVVAIASIDAGSGEIVAGPDIVSRGFVYVREAEQLIEEARGKVRETMERRKQGPVTEWAGIKSAVKDSLAQFLYERTKRRPMILPIIMEV